MLVSDITMALADDGTLRALRQFEMGYSGWYHLPKWPKPSACAVGIDRSFVIGLPELR